MDQFVKNVTMEVGPSGNTTMVLELVLPTFRNVGEVNYLTSALNATSEELESSNTALLTANKEIIELKRINDELRKTIEYKNIRLLDQEKFLATFNKLKGNLKWVLDNA